MTRLRLFLIGSAVTFVLGASAAVVIVLAPRDDGSPTATNAGDRRPAIPRPEDVPAPQRATFADGVVEPAELERAVLAMMTCLDDHGIAHSDPTLNTDRFVPEWEYTYSIMPLSDQERIEREAEACYVEHLRATQGAWVTQNGPSQEEILHQQQAVVDCANDHGIEASDFETLQDIRPSLSAEDSRTVGMCNALGLSGQNLFEDK